MGRFVPRVSLLGAHRGAVALAAVLAALLGALALGSVLVAPAGSPAASPAPTLPVARYETLAPLERETSRLSGTVTDRAGSALAGALACAHPAAAAPILCGATDAAGRFSLTVSADFHKLHVLPPPGPALVGEWFEERDRSRLAELLDLRQADREDIHVALAAGARLEGTVTERAGGAAMADALVCAVATASPIDGGCSRTDANGRYAMVLTPERYSVLFVPPDGTRLITQWWRAADSVIGAAPVDLRGGDRDGVDAALVEGHLIHGVVTSRGGVPIEDVLVCADTPLPTGRVCRPTDREGGYQVAVRAGTFVLQFRPPAASGYRAEWHGGTPDRDAAVRVSVVFDVRIDAALERGRLLSGRVTGPDGERPIEGATINVYDATLPCCVAVATAATGRSGTYATVVSEGGYWVQAFPPTGTMYIATFFGGAFVAEEARVVLLDDSVGVDATYVDVALEEVRFP